MGAGDHASTPPQDPNHSRVIRLSPRATTSPSLRPSPRVHPKSTAPSSPFVYGSRLSTRVLGLPAGRLMAAAAAERGRSWYLSKEAIWWNHGLVSDDYLLNESCLHNSIVHPSPACNATFNVSSDEQGNIDMHNIYAPTCNETAASSSVSGRRPKGRYMSAMDDWIV